MEGILQVGHLLYQHVAILPAVLKVLVAGLQREAGTLRCGL